MNNNTLNFDLDVSIYVNEFHYFNIQIVFWLVKCLFLYYVFKMKCKLKMHLIFTTCKYKYCFEMRALSAGVLRALTIALRRPLGCFPIPHSTCSGMVALIWKVPHNSSDVGTHADSPGAGFAFAVPSCNCTFAKRNPQLIFDRSNVSTFDFGAKKAWPSAIQIFEVGRCPDTSRRMPVPFQLVDANRQRAKLCVVQLSEVG